jgi:hypothetical protein
MAPPSRRLEIALDGGERRPQLVRHVGDELRAHLLELTQRRDVVEHHGHPGLAGPQPQGHRVHLQDALDRSAQAQLAAHHRRLRGRADPRRAPLAEHGVEVRVANHLEKRLALHVPRLQVEHRPRPLVHEQDVIVSIHRDDALDHPVEDGGGLRLLLGEVLDLLPEARGEHVERAAERADLVRRAHRRPDAKLPSLSWRAIDCISTTGRVTRPETKRPMPSATVRATRPPASITRCTLSYDAVTSDSGTARRSTPTSRSPSRTGRAT